MICRTAQAASLGLPVLLFALVAGVRPAGAAGASIDAASTRAAIVAAVERERRTYGGRTPVPAVLVGVWDRAGQSYVHAFGYADLAKRTPLLPADHFRIGSNTKTFVIDVLLQLADEGKLRLDDPLSKFSLGVTIPNARNITVRELCQMRSGLFEAYDVPNLNINITGSMIFKPRTLVSWAMKQKPYFAPGARYKYTNTNYLILGLIVESITHDTIGHQIQSRLLDRFGLHNTSFPATQAMPEPWAHGYGLDKNENWQDVSGTIPVSLMWAAGEMISSMADMKRWVKIYVTGQGVSAASQRAKMQCVYTGEGNLSFGLGIGCSAGWFGYTGGLPGYNTANYYEPSTGTTIVAWVTLQRDTPFPSVANAIFRDIARIVSPGNVPFVKTAGSGGKSGL
jgi:D-alanyl-D-alanine carboxypeptidase